MMEERSSENEMRQRNQDRVALLPWLGLVQEGKYGWSIAVASGRALVVVTSCPGFDFLQLLLLCFPCTYIRTYQQLLLVAVIKFCRNFVNAFINLPKSLVAAVNGPAVGITVTILGLYDFVYAADTVS